MALRATVTIPKGNNLSALHPEFEHCVKATDTTLNNAYVRVVNYQGEKERCAFNLGIFDESGEKLIFTERYSFEPSVLDDAPNIVMQCYLHAKTLVVYENAVDC